MSPDDPDLSPDDEATKDDGDPLGRLPTRRAPSGPSGAVGRVPSGREVATVRIVETPLPETARLTPSPVSLGSGSLACTIQLQTCST